MMMHWLISHDAIHGKPAYESWNERWDDWHDWSYRGDGHTTPAGSACSTIATSSAGATGATARTNPAGSVGFAEAAAAVGLAGLWFHIIREVVIVFPSRKGT